MTALTRRAVLAGGTAGLVATAAPPAAAFAQERIIPTHFEDGIIYATPVTADGHAMKLLTDTGGGLFLLEPAVARLGLDVETATVDGRQTSLASLPGFRQDAWIPEPVGSDSRMPVMPAAGEGKMFADRGLDGMLGQAWFGDRVWTFDYPAKKLLLGPVSFLSGESGKGVAPLEFQTRDGRRSTHFPLIRADIAGETLDLLFDTGAQSPLTPGAQAVLGPGGEWRASSFIGKSVADRWRAANPDWPVVLGGEKMTGMDLVRAPNVRVAGLDLGPAWFAVRPDKNFTEWMSQWMARPIVGALGASAFSRARIVADYPAALARFEVA